MKFVLLRIANIQAFQDAISEMNSDSFMVPLTRSMGLVLEEFYNTYSHCFLFTLECILWVYLLLQVKEWVICLLPLRRQRRSTFHYSCHQFEYAFLNCV